MSALRILLPAGALLALLPAVAFASCDGAALPLAEIHVEAIQTHEPEIDRSLTVLELNRLARERLSAQRTSGRVLGLTSAEVHIRLAELRLSAARDGDGYCVRPSRLRLVIEAQQRVYVVRSAAAGTCWDAGILSHEMEHVGFNNEAVRNAARNAEATLSAMARQPLLVNDPAQARVAWRTRARQVLQDAARAALAEAGRKHAEIDTPKNYQATYNKIRRACGI